MASSHLEPSLARSASVASPRATKSRTQSISSDRPSTISHGLASPPLSVSPEAAFIASSAASQIVTNDHDSHADSWYDESGMLPAGETAVVTPRALQLVNNFLDQLLFNFLQLSKGTTLATLRPAVSEVLKPKLAKDAINNADEELREYLGAGDEEEFVQTRGVDPGRDWDLELVWKRARLRCMVYSSLGDMEEEEEDTYMEQEHLEIGADEQFSDVISPAVAIFLTSVLEYMGELTLTVAGQAAYHRLRTGFEKEIKEGTRSAADTAERIVVTDVDMERVALDRTLGRLWRGWKKRIRAPSMIEFGSRPYSRSSVGHMRAGSNVTDTYLTPKPATSDAGSETRQELDEPLAREAGNKGKNLDRDDAGPVESLEPTEVPLPIGENDVDEIEVPGLAYNSDEGEDDDEYYTPAQRPWSFLHPSTLLNLETLQSDPSRLSKRQRSFSLPSHGSSRFIVLDSDDTAIDEAEENSEEVISEQPEEETSKSEGASKMDKAEPGQEQARKRPVLAALDITPNHQPGAIGVAKTTDEKIRKPIPEDMDGDTYEKAEIVTSARVSVASSTPSGSEGGSRKTNSISSARIVDVAGPKGSGSRSPSIDTTERPQRRSASLSRASHSSSPSVTEGSLKPRCVDNAAYGSSFTSLRSSPDGMRPPRQNASTISESEEESDQTSTNRGNPYEAVTSSANISLTGAAGETTPRAKGRPSSAVQSSTIPSTSRQQHTPSNTKVTIVTKSNSAGAFIDEPIPEVPFRAPARRSPKLDAASGQVARHKDSEDTALYPIQSNTSQRQTHTSGSSSSSATTRMKATRTSEEHVPSHAESVARNFEELIHSNQTITYTLTPENMRDMDSPRSIDSPGRSRFPRAKADDYKPGDRSRSSSTATDAKGSRMVAVGSHSPSESKGHRPSPISVPGPSSTMSASKSTTMRSPPTGPSSMSPAGPKSHRAPASLPRDARVPADTTADFAEFIKSTGPPGDNRPPPIRSANNTASPAKSSSAKTSLDSRRVSQTANRNRYQPRDAAVDSKGDNSDLIDFIRQGPPGSSASHRIPRHVAPFRNTMDSDHMTGGSGGRAVDATIPEVHSSRTSTGVTERSMPSTVNSNSALLRHKQQPAQNTFDEGGMMPQRKQRRVRDPYAVDFSDEDDDLLMTPQPPAKKEESLAEFLRNYDPPPEPQGPPISQKIPKKKASAPSLIGRFARAGFGRDHKEPKEANSTNGKAAPESRSLSSRTGTAYSSGARSGHVPLQVNMPSSYDKYGASETNTGRPRMGSNPVPGRVPMKKFEPRDATPAMTRTGTADLAAFLRDSGPPAGATGPSVRSTTADESSGLSKMWARRKNLR